MQGQRSALDSFPETVDLNQGSVSNNTGMDQSPGWNNMPNPVDSQLSNYMLASGEGNFNCGNALSHHGQSFSGWDFGESSSRGNTQDQVSSDDFKMENALPSSFSACTDPNAGIQERSFEQSNIHLFENVSTGLGGNQVTRGPSSIRSSGSSRIPLDVNLNAGYTGNTGDGGQLMGGGVCPNLFRSGRSEMEQITRASSPSNDVGTSSGSSHYTVENDGRSNSSLGSWGLSCKRKALEGTSGQFHEGGSSSFFSRAENIAQHTIPPRHNACSGLRISSHPVNSRVAPVEQLNSRFVVGMTNVDPDVLPLSGVAGVAESSTSNFGMRTNLGPQESVALNMQSTGNATRPSSVCSPHQSSRPISFSESMDYRATTALPTNTSNPSSQSHLMHHPGLSRNTIPLSWSGALNSRAGSSSSSLTLFGDRSTALQDDGFRSALVNHAEQSMFIPATETRNLVQDMTAWGLAARNSNTSGGVPSNSNFGLTSRAHPFPSDLIPHHNPPNQNQQRLPEFVPWTLFPSVEPEARGERGHFSSFRSGPPSSSEETVMSSAGTSHVRHQPHPSSALLMELPADDVNGLRALAADIEGRQRLVSEIRQVLNAMRRGRNLRAEDYMLFDPFINGVAELHDRHRDMRLDVDNMSYEELLALEERIGNVSTGLSEETIVRTLKQRKYISIPVGSPLNSEPCCICQEEYVIGDAMGTLDCGHDFHTDCIKRWLTQKNLCPICKMTALNT